MFRKGISILLVYITFFGCLSIFMQSNNNQKAHEEIRAKEVIHVNKVVSPSLNKEERVPQTERQYKGKIYRGVASWYGEKFQGKITKSGEPFDKEGLTAAHRYLPMNSYVKVINPSNGRSVIVKINDRGPFITDEDGNYTRIIDVSERVARELGFTKAGLAGVKMEILSVGT